MINTYNFEEFKSFGSRMATNYVGITKNGSISFYRGFCKRNNLQSFEKCVILYDRDKKVIGLQFGDKSLGERAYPINFDDERKIGWISANNFFKLNPELQLYIIKGRYKPEKYEDESRKNVFLIDLNKRVNQNK